MQVFLDVVESVNLLVNSNGTVVRSEVVGTLKMRTFLSGMPECKLGLNDKVRALFRRNCLVAKTASPSTHYVVREVRMHRIVSTGRLLWSQGSARHDLLVTFFASLRLSAHDH